MKLKDLLKLIKTRHIDLRIHDKFGGYLFACNINSKTLEHYEETEVIEIGIRDRSTMFIQLKI